MITKEKKRERVKTVVEFRTSLPASRMDRCLRNSQNRVTENVTEDPISSLIRLIYVLDFLPSHLTNMIAPIKQLVPLMVHKLQFRTIVMEGIRIIEKYIYFTGRGTLVFIGSCRLILSWSPALLCRAWCLAYLSSCA